MILGGYESDPYGNKEIENYCVYLFDEKEGQITRDDKGNEITLIRDNSHPMVKFNDNVVLGYINVDAPWGSRLTEYDRHTGKGRVLGSLECDYWKPYRPNKFYSGR